METDGDGVVWVGTSGGVRWFDGYQFLAPLTGPQTGPKPDPATGDPPDILGDIRRIVCLGNGDIAVQAGSSLWIGRSGKLRRIPTSAKVGQNRPTRA